MLKSIVTAIAVLSMAAGTAAYAGNGNGNGNGNCNGNCDGNGKTVSAPEIDPTSAGSALILLAGGLAIIRGRRDKI